MGRNRHIFHEASLWPSGRNPLDATWLDEDWIKKVKKICKRCHKLAVSRTMPDWPAPEAARECFLGLIGPKL